MAYAFLLHLGEGVGVRQLAPGLTSPLPFGRGARGEGFSAGPNPVPLVVTKTQHGFSKPEGATNNDKGSNFSSRVQALTPTLTQRERAKENGAPTTPSSTSRSALRDTGHVG
ncbi:MAG: hypothetical protein QOK48_1489 [Blastocatellia bacterium]|nr:hypothetical protein [Blastocatellia bacterium]